MPGAWGYARRMGALCEVYNTTSDRRHVRPYDGLMLCCFFCPYLDVHGRVAHMEPCANLACDAMSKGLLQRPHQVRQLGRLLAMCPKHIPCSSSHLRAATRTNSPRSFHDSSVLPLQKSEPNPPKRGLLNRSKTPAGKGGKSGDDAGRREQGRAVLSVYVRA